MATLVCLIAFVLVVGLCGVLPEVLDRRELKREWAKYDADRAAENERQRLYPGSRPVPTGGRPSATRPRYCAWVSCLEAEKRETIAPQPSPEMLEAMREVDAIAPAAPPITPRFRGPVDLSRLVPPSAVAIGVRPDVPAWSRIERRPPPPPPQPTSAPGPGMLARR